MDTIALLTTLDQKYLPQLQVLLTSLHASNPGERIVLYLLHSGIPREALDRVERQCALWKDSFCPILVEDALFENAPVTRQYPKEMYYRLLAPHLLPGELKRVLLVGSGAMLSPTSTMQAETIPGIAYAARLEVR